MGRTVRRTRLLDQVKDDRSLLLGSPAMERLGAVSPVSLRARAGRALRRPQNWVELVKFFVVAVTNNYAWNRLWTFRRHRGHLYYQGLRFFIVSLVALGTNLVVLRLLVALELDKVTAQAIAIIVVTPLNFVGNKLWSFRRA